MIEFFVAGSVAAKGSLKPFMFKGHDGRTHVRMTEQLSKTKPWMALVTAAAHDAMAGRAVLSKQALQVRAVFGFARPAGHIGTHGIKASAPIAPVGPPDLDKLCRAIGDGLKGVVFDDDSRIVSWAPTKIYVPLGCPTGALITIEPLEAGLVLLATTLYAEAATR